MIERILIIILIIPTMGFLLIKLLEQILGYKIPIAGIIEGFVKEFLNKKDVGIEKLNENLSHGENILNELEEFIGKIQKRNKDPGDTSMIKKAKNILSNVKEFVNNPSSSASQPILKMLLSTISPGGSVFDGFTNGNRYVITDDPDHPFQITTMIKRTAERITTGCKSDNEKAQAIFNWMTGTIEYDYVKYDKITSNKNSGKYKTSKEVFDSRKGVCGEIAVLYVVMARSVSLKSHYVHVHVDNSGKKVNHTCASVVISGEKILVDPAYNTFDIDHQKFRTLDDKAAVDYFRNVRRS